MNDNTYDKKNVNSIINIKNWMTMWEAYLCNFLFNNYSYITMHYFVMVNLKLKKQSYNYDVNALYVLFWIHIN